MKKVTESRYPVDMDGLLVLLEEARSSLASAVAGRSDVELTELHDVAGWSAKDHLYHLAVWQRAVRFLLQGRPLNEGVELTAEEYRNLDVDSQNAVTVERNRDRTIGNVMQVLWDEHRKLVQYLASPEITWDDLQRPFGEYAPDDPFEGGNEPVLFFVIGDTVHHFEMHQRWIEEILIHGNA